MRKKIAFTAAIILSSFMLTQAQSLPGPSVFIKGGLNLSNVTITRNGNTDNNRVLPTFQVGFQADLPLTGFLALQPGIIFSGKGSKIESGNPSGLNWYRATTHPYYIELPLNAVIKLPLGNQSCFFVGAGPYLGIGITGNNKVEGQTAGVYYSRTQSIQFSNDDPFTGSEGGSGYNTLRRYDYGINGTVGIQSAYAQLAVNYGWGLAKLQSGTTSSADELDKYRIWSLTLGFKL